MSLRITDMCRFLEEKLTPPSWMCVRVLQREGSGLYVAETGSNRVDSLLEGREAVTKNQPLRLGKRPVY